MSYHRFDIGSFLLVMKLLDVFLAEGLSFPLVGGFNEYLDGITAELFAMVKSIEHAARYRHMSAEIQFFGPFFHFMKINEIGGCSKIII